MNKTNTNTSAARDAGHPLNRLRHRVTAAIERGDAVAIVERPAPEPLTLHRFAREIVTQCDGDLDDAQFRAYVRFRAEKVLSDIPDPSAEIARLRAAHTALAGKGDK
jgi:hypothetical protein